MRRTKPSGVSVGSSEDDLVARNMSYTNLAAMASTFETHLHIVPAGGSSSTRAASGGSPDALHAQAMELINTGLKLDLNAPMQAVELYHKGADLLSQALEVASTESAEQMQRRLDMVEERVRFISREQMGRSMSDSQVRPRPAPAARRRGLCPR